MKKDVKNIVVISLGFLGDTLLVESMCRNLKCSIPKSNLIFIVNEVFGELPLGFESVDKIYSYDKKNKHKGLLGYWKFLKIFQEKDIDYAIITHPHERSLILAKVIGAKNIISLPIKRSFLNFLINKRRKFMKDELRTTYKADYNNGYLEGFCDYENMPIKYEREDINQNEILDKFQLSGEYIVLSPTSKDLIKDWNYKNIKEFILNISVPVVLVGTDKAKNIANQLKNENIDFMDLTLKTSITELAVIIKNSKCCVSVDTGTFHLAYAQGVKTLALFYDKQKVVEWAPSDTDCVQVLLGERVGVANDFVCVKEITAKEVLEKMVD